MFLHHVRRGVVLAFVSYTGTFGVVAAEPPLEDLLRPPFLGSADLSPNGRYLAAVNADRKDQRNLVVLDLEQSTGGVTGIAGTKNFDLYSAQWLSDERLLFNVSRQRLYAYGLYSAPRAALHRHEPINSFDVVHVVGRPRSRPDHAILWVTKDAERDGLPGGVYEVNARRGVREFYGTAESAGSLAVRNYEPPTTGVLVGLASDIDGELALAFVYRDQRTIAYRYRSSTWIEIPLDLSIHHVLGVDPDPDFLWVARKEGAESVLGRFHLPSATFEAPVHADRDYALSYARLFFSPRTRTLAGIIYHQQRLASFWQNEAFALAQAAVDKHFPDWDNELLDVDEQERRFLYRGTSAKQPGVYLLFDAQKPSLQVVARAASWLEGSDLADTLPITFNTRDGARLEGYLTLPPAASPAAPVPLVVLPHGGPAARDTWTFNPTVQFLALRGYAVLQPNYRGSRGYLSGGPEPDFNFPRMHDDVTDAARAMAGHPLIDSNRVAIMGRSFGGYLALTGAAFEGDLYRCAISICGIFDWEELARNQGSGGRPGAHERLLDQLGQPGLDSQRFAEISPLDHVDQIAIPVFIAHGKENSIFSVSLSKRLAAALKKRRVPSETYSQALEAHDFFNYENNLKLHRRLEAFLAKHLRAESAAAPK